MAKKNPAATTAPTLSPPPGSVTVRCYRMGFGDCFLFAFRLKGGQVKYVMIDCGVVVKADAKPALFKKVIADIAKATGGKLDALAVTHEHYDHVCGFDLAIDDFKRSIRVGEVWAAWTENPGDDFAKTLDNEKKAGFAALGAALARMTEAGLTNRRDTAIVRDKLGFLGFDAGADGKTAADLRLESKKLSASVDKAMDAALGLVRTPTYFEPGVVEEEPAGIPGLRMYVLGPPKNYNFLYKENPDEGEAYAASPALGLAAIAAAGSWDDDAFRPFAPRWCARRARDAKERNAAIRDLYEGVDVEEWRCIDNDWLTSTGRLALQLDVGINNTSLALAFEIVETGRVLFFPGDAQTGSWRSWQTLKFRLPSGAASKLDTDNDGIVTIADIFKRVALYKVGHHGSHNGTMKAQGLEMMDSPDLAAFVPVSRAHAVASGWKKIPEKDLMTELRRRCRGRVLTSEPDEKEPSKRPAPDGVTNGVWSKFAGAVMRGPGGLYYDVTIK